MKKIFALVFATALLSVVACSKNPEAQAKEMMVKMATVFDTAATKLTAAGDDKAAAAALTAFSAEMAKIVVEGKALEAKNPDFKLDEKKDAFKEETKKMEEAMKKFQEAMMASAVKYADSEVFKKAIEDMQTAMSSAGEKK
jgi:hypothetical protein